MVPLDLPIDEILDTTAAPGDDTASTILGHSRADRPVVGHRLGNGPCHISLIAGCHADEPVGPAMLGHLVTWLTRQPDDAPCKRAATWFVVPDANPDGAQANRRWFEQPVALDGPRAGSGYDLHAYLRHAVREAPGDDIEFGFPRTAADDRARPENHAIAAFLDTGAPFALHASFHGMAFAAGPWFLLERAWIGRTATLRAALRAVVQLLGYTVHDIDRGGDKGFDRIDAGFTTRPDSVAMATHFRDRGDHAMAERFRPSSMEYVRARGGDPLTLVSEMPLFLVPQHHYRGGDIVRPPVLADLAAHAARGDATALRHAAAEIGIEAMPIRDQMRLQLAYLVTALHTVADQSRNQRSRARS